MDWKEWCSRTVSHVRFKPDRKTIEKELTDHYEDHKRDLERIGYAPKLAAERALRAMGDADAVGEALNRAHKPWLGWLWEVSRVLVLSLFLLTAVILLRNSQWTAQEMIDRTVDQFTWQAPPVGADCAVTEYATLYLAPGEVTEKDGGYQVALNLWVETGDPRTGLPRIHRYMSVEDDQGPIPIDSRSEDGTWPDNYVSQGFSSVSYGWTRHQVVYSLYLDHRPEWVEITYPHGGNDWVLRAEWGAAE